MSGPIVFISHNRVKPGKLEALEAFYRESVKEIEAEKPGTLIHLGYASKDGTEMTFVHLLLDADAMDAHMQGAAERAQEAYEFIESARIEVYGPPSEGVLEALQRITGLGVEFHYEPHHLGGYFRLG